MERWRGKWALITGASAGIGWALAEELAAGGTNLVLTARRRERLEALAEQLVKQHNIRVEVVPADLILPMAPEQLFAFTEKRGIAVDLLVNNAGFGTFGWFATSDRVRQLAMVQVNIAAVVALTHLYLPGMIHRRRGDILIVASVAGFQGLPYLATYAASKAFDLLFAEALAEEVGGYGIRVCALCPGSTATEFQQVAGEPHRLHQHTESAAKVARVGLKALARGRSYAISGVANYLGAHAQRLVPRQLVNRMAAKMLRPAD
jgi:short-subunit dehydrogenase